MQGTIKHLMYVDNIKIFAKNEFPMQTVKIFGQDIKIEFGIFKRYAVILTKSGKIETTEEMELPNQKSIGTGREKRKLQITGNIQTEYHQTNRNERKSLKKVPQKN